MDNSDVKSLAHTKCNCECHIVFAPKYRRKVFFENKRLLNIKDFVNTNSEKTVIIRFFRIIAWSWKCARERFYSQNKQNECQACLYLWPAC